MLTEIPAEQFSVTVETVVREVLAEVEWFRPPVDALAIAERLGLVVARDTTMDVRARFVRLSGVGGMGTRDHIDGGRTSFRTAAVGSGT